MSRIYDQISQQQGFEYNRGWKDADSYAAYQQREREKAWQWWEETRDELNQQLSEDGDAISYIIFDNGVTIIDQIQRRH